MTKRQRELLKKAALPVQLKKILGKRFVFTYHAEDNKNRKDAVTGRISNLNFHGTWLTLHVSVPRNHSFLCDVKALSNYGEGWFAIKEKRTCLNNRIQGELQLL